MADGTMMVARERVLVVDPDASAREALDGVLAAQGYTVWPAADARSADKVLAAETIDVVLSEIRLPGDEGLAFCRRVAQPGGPSLIILSAAASEADRVLGLELGADDYLAKPASPRELMARIRAIRRRRRRIETPVEDRARYIFGMFELDVGRRELATPARDPIVLQPATLDLLLAFLERPKKVLTREELGRAAGLEADSDTRAMDMRVSRLRRTLKAFGGRDPIRTMRGSGYVLSADVEVRRSRA